MMNRKKKFLKDIAITTVFGGLISFLSYLFNIYLARHLGNSDFGIYSAAVGIIYLIQIPATTIQAYITQKVAENKNFDLSKFKKKSILTFSVIGLILALAYLPLADIIEKNIGIPSQYSVALSFVIFASAFSPVAKGILFGLQKIFAVNVVMLLETILKFVLGYIAIHYVNDLNIPIIANGLPFLLSGIILLPLIKLNKEKEKKLKLDFKHLGYVFTSFLLINIPFTLDLILVNPEIRPEYSALSLMGKIVFFACITIASTMFAAISEAKDEKTKANYLTYAVIIAAVIGISISIVFLIFDSSLVSIIFKGKYGVITPYVGFYGLGMTLYAIAYLISNYIINIKEKFYPYLLLILPITQVSLYFFYNNSLQEIFRNQIVLFGVFFLIALVMAIRIDLKNA